MWWQGRDNSATEQPRQQAAIPRPPVLAVVQVLPAHRDATTKHDDKTQAHQTQTSTDKTAPAHKQWPRHKFRPCKKATDWHLDCPAR
jgi:hypothetical protein